MSGNVWKHRLSNKDKVNLTGTCIICGDVKLKRAGHQYKCYNKVRVYKLFKQYGIVVDPTNIPDSCVVCGSKKRISLDHCHRTNNNRGWLCMNCNVALGMAKDNPDTLRNLAKYLENSLL